MMRPIKVKNIKDIERINSIVCKYPFDIWIHGKSGMVDAKSILGMYALILKEPISLVIPDDVNYDSLFKELEQLVIFD